MDVVVYGLSKTGTSALFYKPPAAARLPEDLRPGGAVGEQARMDAPRASRRLGAAGRGRLTHVKR